MYENDNVMSGLDDDQRTRLVDLFKEAPELYDRGHPRFHKITSSSKIWSNLGLEVGLRGDEVREIFSTLKETMIDLTARVRESLVGPQKLSRSELKFIDNFSFLTPDSGGASAISSPDKFSTKREYPGASESAIETIDLDDYESPPSSPNRESAPSAVVNAPPPQKKIKLENSDQFETLHNLIKIVRDTNMDIDEDEAFVRFVYTELKKMEPNMKDQVKWRIQCIMHNRNNSSENIDGHFRLEFRSVSFRNSSNANAQRVSNSGNSPGSSSACNRTQCYARREISLNRTSRNGETGSVNEIFRRRDNPGNNPGSYLTGARAHYFSRREIHLNRFYSYSRNLRHYSFAAGGRGSSLSYANANRSGVVSEERVRSNIFERSQRQTNDLGEQQESPNNNSIDLNRVPFRTSREGNVPASTSLGISSIQFNG
ncbi:DgyrCDS13685 [Dimorphilus gyrociliatus]|uniref:DgyrCDS13685 n=1 Tax=Dimorphilus gyrociliatus TaxID=2664684 RepID=A0A7I8WBF6_9ANNE|nr:DgyrCDS13685 [Dimorphilus gyrociliatus]